LALAALALVVVPTVQARSTTFSPQGRHTPSSAQGQQVHGVAPALYRRLPSDDQADLAGTGSIGGYAPDAAQPASQPSSGSGFDWSSAGIGVGTTLAGVVLLALCGAAVLSRRRGVAHA
jgi:hypothetical protein